MELRPYTLIIGENNTGKTNLLEALRLIFNQEITYYKKRELELSDINNDCINKFKEDVGNAAVPIDQIEFPEVLVAVELSDVEAEPNQHRIVSKWLCDTALSKAHIAYRFHLKDSWDKRDEWLEEQREFARQGNSDAIELPLHKYDYGIYTSDRKFTADDFRLMQMIKLELLDAFRDAKKELVATNEYRLLFRVLNSRNPAKFTDIQSAITTLNQSLRVNTELQAIEKKIEELMELISLKGDSVNNAIKFSFGSTVTGDILKKLSLLYGADPISIERNGLGRNNLLYISLVLSHLCNSDGGSENIFFRVVGIEEPEAHLHPHLQNHLASNIEVLADSKMQIIATSHSAHIAAKSEFKNTHILYKQDGKVHEHCLLKGMNEHPDSVTYLSKFLDATNATMFFARKIIFVEGVAEEMLLHTLFKVYTLQKAEEDRSEGDDTVCKCKTLEEIGCNIVNVRGLAFSHFLEIVKQGYFVKCAVFTDSDADAAEQRDENRAAQLKTDYGSDIISVCITETSTFEKELIDMNKNGTGKEILITALKATRPRLATNLTTIVTAQCFGFIENYKSEFALNLNKAILAHANKSAFSIPAYIKEGFDFILGSVS